MVHILLFSILVLLFGTIGHTKAEAASKYPYLIKVNKQCNTVTIYKQDAKGKYTVPVKAMICSTGKATPLGTFKTPAKYRWKVLQHDVWGQYSTRITGSILFHSVWYYEKDPSTLSIKQYNRLGTQASAGCVRLTTADAKWIYDNCPVGTTVKIYKSKKPGPLGKPKSIKLSKYSWDPTDKWSKGNPWNKKKPSIKASNITVLAGTTVDLKKGVKATDTCGNNITSSIKIDKSKLNLKKAGTYKVTYSVTDAAGKKAKKTIKVKVVDASKITFKGVSNKVYRYSKYKNKKLSDYVMKGVSAKAGKYTLDKKYLSYSSKVIQNDKSAVVYEIIYKAKNPQTKKVTKKKATITLDKQGPQITYDTLYLTKAEYNTFVKQLKNKNFSYIKVKDNVTPKSKITVSATRKKVDATTYKVTYVAKDAVGNTTKKTQKVYILNSPKLVVNKETVEVTSEQKILADAKNNFKITASGKDYTSALKDKVTIKCADVKADGICKVTYTLKLGDITLTAHATYVVKATEK